jgi:hypothetical protein
MGWTSSRKWKTKSDIVEAILEEHGSITAHKLVGDELWTVQDIGDDIIIVLYLFEREGMIWAYKDMGESCGPFYYRCPLEFLDCASEKNIEWRNSVRELAAK